MGTIFDSTARKIRVYDTDGNTRIDVAIQVGDTVHYKRNGQTGFITCTVVHLNDASVRLRPLSPDDENERAFAVPLKSRHFMRALRNGERLRSCYLDATPAP